MERLKYISRFLVQAIPASKEKDKAAPRWISGGQAFTSAECIKFPEEKEAQSKQTRRKNKSGKKEEKGSIKLEKKKEVNQRNRKNINNDTKNIEDDICPVCQVS